MRRRLMQQGPLYANFYSGTLLVKMTIKEESTSHANKWTLKMRKQCSNNNFFADQSILIRERGMEFIWWNDCIFMCVFFGTVLSDYKRFEWKTN